jgi:hypothetical protein
MATPIHRKITGWIFNHLLWDTAGRAREGFWRIVWGTRKVLLALVGSALLTWLEWTKHHPPDMAVVAILHFVFMLIATALVVQIGPWFGRTRRGL